MDEKKKEEKVFIACRAKEGCPGREAIITLVRNNTPNMPGGGFMPESGGRMVRYRCLTCGGTFTIQT